MFGTREAVIENPVVAVERAAAEALERGPELADLGMLAAAALRFGLPGLQAYEIVWRYLRRNILPETDEAAAILLFAAEMRQAELALHEARMAHPSEDDFRAEQAVVANSRRRSGFREEVDQGDLDRSTHQNLARRYADAVRIASLHMEQLEQRLVEQLGVSWRTHLQAKR